MAGTTNVSRLGRSEHAREDERPRFSILHFHASPPKAPQGASGTIDHRERLGHVGRSELQMHHARRHWLAARMASNGGSRQNGLVMYKP